MPEGASPAVSDMHGRLRATTRIEEEYNDSELVPHPDYHMQ